jgi:hypothetical protein
LTLGIIGAVTGIFPFFFWVAGILGIIGLILGFLGRGRAKRGEATNGTIALWGIITSAVAVIISVIGAVILVGVFADLSEEPLAETENTVSPVAENTVTPPVETSAPAEETAPTAPVKVDAYKLEVGDCYAEVPEGELITVPVVPCAEPHIYEVYAQLSIPEGDYPGDDAIFEQTDELCIAEFEPFVGLSYEESVLDVFYLSPTEESWLAGDHAVTCSVYDPGEDVTGSLRGVER